MEINPSPFSVLARETDLLNSRLPCFLIGNISVSETCFQYHNGKMEKQDVPFYNESWQEFAVI